MPTRRFLFILTISTLSLLPALVQAQPFVPLADYSGTPEIKNAYSSSSLPQYLSSLFKIALSIGAIIAVVRLVWAGYQYMGSDMWSKKSDAKDIIKDVIWGILLLLGTYLILYQINPCILNLDILQSFGSSPKPCQYPG